MVRNVEGAALPRGVLVSQVALPRINVDGNDASQGASTQPDMYIHPWGEPPPAVYTERTRSLVQSMEAWVAGWVEEKAVRPQLPSLCSLCVGR